MKEDAAIRRAKAITRELDSLTGYCERIAAERRDLIRCLNKSGWSQHKIAAELGISQPAVHKILEK